MSTAMATKTVFDTASTDIRRAIIRAHTDGIDIGELLVSAVTDANRQIVKRDGWGGVTSNRPGSWEAAIVDQLIGPDGW